MSHHIFDSLKYCPTLGWSYCPGFGNQIS